DEHQLGVERPLARHRPLARLRQPALRAAADLGDELIVFQVDAGRHAFRPRLKLAPPGAAACPPAGMADTRPRPGPETAPTRRHHSRAADAAEEKRAALLPIWRRFDTSVARRTKGEGRKGWDLGPVPPRPFRTRRAGTPCSGPSPAPEAPLAAVDLLVEVLVDVV